MELKKYSIKDLKNLKVDTYEDINNRGYQRKINEVHLSKVKKAIEKKIKEENIEKMSPIYVSIRENGDSFVVDGQHRRMALMELYENQSIGEYEEVKINVLEYHLNRKEEIQLFLDLNYYGKNVNSSLATILDLESRKLEDFEITTKSVISKLHAKSSHLAGKFPIGESERGKLSYRALYTTIENLVQQKFPDITDDDIYEAIEIIYNEAKAKWINVDDVLEKNTGWFTIYYIIYIEWDKELPYEKNLYHLRAVIQESKITSKDWQKGGLLREGSSMSYYKRNALYILSNQNNI